MMEDRMSTKRRGLGLLVSMALVGALLVPLAVASTASADSNAQCGVAQGGGDCCVEEGVTQDCPQEPYCPGDYEEAWTQGKAEVCCPNAQESAAAPAVTQGEIDDVCCADETTAPITNGGVTQGGGQDVGVACCPNGEFGHWEWGGYAGQNLSYCDAPPYEPPATAPAPSVSPATAAPKKAVAAAAKPTFTG